MTMGLRAFDYFLIFALVAAGQRPDSPPGTIIEYLGEYGVGVDRVIVLESGGQLHAVRGKGSEVALFPAGKDRFTLEGKPWAFTRGQSGRIVSLRGDSTDRRKVEFPDDGAVFRIRPVRPVEKIRGEALKQAPPVEKGPFRKPDLIDLTTVDKNVHLDIRYATPNNFMGAPMYSEAKAFLQRPAAEALGRAALDLKQQGFGLLIHDAYRPWYVTWMFWEATPPKQHVFVANPSEGSRHNRGCAVDLSLYELASGKPLSMPSVYDEMTDRAYPDYRGGSTLQRWNRSVLRIAMEKQGFEVNRAEWWHFDYRDWKQYPIGTVRFEDLHR